MSPSIRDILVISDMDGTLLDSENNIPPCNLETIRLFRALGGHFTVATGRTFASVGMYPELTAVIDPAITSGGAVIYDFAKNEPAQSMILPHLAAHQALRDVMQEFPALGVMVMGNDMRLYKLTHSADIQKLIDDEQMTYFSRPSEDLPDEWNKVLFAGPPETLEAVAAYVAAKTYPGVYFVNTSAYYFEMMPKGVSKGSAIRELCTMLDLSIKNTTVIGDYYNDLDMMKQAGYAVAVRNAPKEIIDISNEVTASNDEGGVGQYLYKIIEKYDK